MATRFAGVLASFVCAWIIVVAGTTAQAAPPNSCGEPGGPCGGKNVGDDCYVAPPNAYYGTCRFGGGISTGYCGCAALPMGVPAMPVAGLIAMGLGLISTASWVIWRRGSSTA